MSCPVSLKFIGIWIVLLFMVYVYAHGMPYSESFSMSDVRTSIQKKPTQWWNGNQTHKVILTDNRISPSYLTIKKGDTVTWVNEDKRPHGIQSHTGLFNGKDLGKGGEFSHTFHSNGVFDYLLSDLPQRIGAIRVAASTQY